MDARKLWEAAGNALVTFLTGILVYKSFADLRADTVFQPFVQALLVGLGALGFRAIPGRAPDDAERK